MSRSNACATSSASTPSAPTRICVAALNQNNLEYVAKAVATVAKA
ncbi:hypothetical protein ACE0DR_28965 [Azotobacter sp. CWF10]